MVVALLGACRGAPPDDVCCDPAPSPGAVVEPITSESLHRPMPAMLGLVPSWATSVSVTDYDAIRARLGVPDLTSEDPMSDRTRFWEQARKQFVLFTDGLLMADNSTLMLDYGFTQDDVDAELRFSGPKGSGYALVLRPDLELAAVSRAVDDGVGPLDSASVSTQLHLVSSGTAEHPGESWAADPEVAGLVGELEPESTYILNGCVPLAEALGVDATYDDQQAVLKKHDIAALEPVSAVGVSFADGLGTAWLESSRDDLDERAALSEDWPKTGPIGFADGFDGLQPVDPSWGRIGLQVDDPVAAATLILTHQLPFAVCNEVRPSA